MLVESALFDAGERKHDLLISLVVLQCLNLCQVDGRQAGVEVKVQGLSITSLAIAQASELFRVTEQKLELKARFVELVNFLRLLSAVGREQDGLAFAPGSRAIH